jgi:hypothetical protein
VPPTSALATRDFGDRWGGLVFAWIFTAHQFGAAAAAWAAGLIRTETGDYTAAFAGAGALALAAGGLALLIAGPARRPPAVAPAPA